VSTSVQGASRTPGSNGTPRSCARRHTVGRSPLQEALCHSRASIDRHEAAQALEVRASEKRWAAHFELADAWQRVLPAPGVTHSGAEHTGGRLLVEIYRPGTFGRSLVDSQTKGALHAVLALCWLCVRAAMSWCGARWRDDKVE